jgi:UDP:flavonoid glycosyltransferase YjiC (YdhE family)
LLAVEAIPQLCWKHPKRLTDCVGDIQPFVALGKRLKQDDHRVRIATHEIFRQLVTEQGLEFFSIGGNPTDLMSYMVKSEQQLRITCIGVSYSRFEILD